MNIITIDPSLTCTAIVCNDKKLVFAAHDKAYSKKDKLVKWFTAVDHLITLHTHTLKSDGELGHAESELHKLDIYNRMTQFIVDQLLLVVTPNTPTKVFIEGYSYSSEAGPLIDLVTFGTLLRHKIYTRLTTDINIVTPSSLKSFAARFTYGAGIADGETVRNKDGVSGGRFTKHDMYKALIENDSLNDDWISMLREHADAILASKSIPKPIEDLNDAKLMYEIAKANKYL